MKILQSSAAAFILGIWILVSGCATTQNMLGTEYEKEFVHDTRAYFSQVQTFTDNDGFKVSGELHLRGTIGVNMPDYVEVALVDTAGEVFEIRKVAYYPRTKNGRGMQRKARFTARFDQPPLIGTVIRLKSVD